MKKSFARLLALTSMVSAVGGSPKLMFPTLGGGGTHSFDYSLMNNNHYNMYCVKIKKDGNAYKAYTTAPMRE